MEIKKIASNSLSFVIKSIVQMAGLFILLIGLFLLTSLLSYSPEDPNFIFQKNTEIQNVLGFKGSVVADLFFQSLGLISILIAISLLFTGVNIIKSKKAVLIIENFFYVILYSLFGALFFATYYSNSFWLSINGNGGFIGKYFESTFLGSLINTNQKISYYILIIIILFLFLISINFKLNSFLNSIKTLFKFLYRKKEKDFINNEINIDQNIEPKSKNINLIQEDLPFVKSSTENKIKKKKIYFTYYRLIKITF